MQPTVLEIFGIHPSNSGNIRVMVTFKNRGDMHFYMKADGSLHIPSQHNEETLRDSFDAFKEFQWVEKTWRETNPNVIKGVLKGEMRQKAFRLTMRLADPIEWKRVMGEAMISKRSQGKMMENSDLAGKLKGIKRDIQKENRKTPDHQTTPPQKRNAQQSVPKEKPDEGKTAEKQKTSFPAKCQYGVHPVEKFNNKYNRARTA